MSDKDLLVHQDSQLPQLLLTVSHPSTHQRYAFDLGQRLSALLILRIVNALTTAISHRTPVYIFSLD